MENLTEIRQAKIIEERKKTVNKISKDKREVLRPYAKRRLSFEGVLISIIEPTKKSGNEYGLVFGSVYAPNEDIEIEHVVMKMKKCEFSKANLELFTRYNFTAEIKPYFKKSYIMGVPANVKCFMLSDLNTNRLEIKGKSDTIQPTLHILKVMTETARGHNNKGLYNEKQMMEIIEKLPNDGSVEKFVNAYRKIHVRKKYNKHKIINTLYK